MSSLSERCIDAFQGARTEAESPLHLLRCFTMPSRLILCFSLSLFLRPQKPSVQSKSMPSMMQTFSLFCSLSLFPPPTLSLDASIWIAPLSDTFTQTHTVQRHLLLSDSKHYQTFPTNILCCRKQCRIRRKYFIADQDPNLP